MTRLILSLILLFASVANAQQKPKKSASKIFVNANVSIIEVAKQFALYDLDIQKADTLVGQVIGTYSGSSLANNKVYIKALRVDSTIILSGKIDFEKGGFLIDGGNTPDMDVVYGSKGTILREAFDKMLSIAKSLNPTSITFDKYTE
jgi:hypothetical protein